MNELNAIIDMIERFLAGKYDAWEFSCDMIACLYEYYDAMDAVNHEATKAFNQNFPEICAEMEPGMDCTNFIKAVRKEYEAVKVYL